jgi:malate dehydrogenase
VEAILKDQKRVLPCAVKCEGEYGIDGLFVGVPAKLGRRGVEGIEQYELSPDEKTALAASAHAVKELCAAVDRLL